ncbi:MAG: two-component system, sensor histidine kinase and response regulator [Actinomycetota bacterium]|nr:two-component system, sensor histidine kinase and response regulator [Actinomycetota bacterium]
MPTAFEKMPTELEQFTSFLGALPDAALLASPTGQILAANAVLCDLAGFSADELLGAPVEMLVPSDRRARHVSHRSAYVAGGGGHRSMSDRQHIVMRRADGIEIPVDIEICTLPDADGGLVVATIRDASRRRKVELAANREQEFQSAIGQVSAAVFSGESLDETFRLITQLARQSLRGDLALLVLPDPQNNNILHVAQADGLGQGELAGSSLPAHGSMAGFTMHNHESVLIENGADDPRFFRPAGWPPQMGATLVAPLQARGEVIGSLTIARLRNRPIFDPAEITFITTFAEKATLVAVLENARASAASALEMSVTAGQTATQLELNRELIKKLEDVDRTKSEFLSRVSHELRAPLTSIIGYVEILIDDGAADTSQDHGAELQMLDTVDRNSKRLLLLIDNLLMISRAESENVRSSDSEIDLSELVQRVQENVAPAVAKGDLTIEIDVPPDLALRGDPEQLERAVLNLVTNAVKFTPPGGSIEITARPVGDFIDISVRDTGCGISPEDQGKLFTRFFRTQRAQELEVQGTGLGLYITRQIVETHGGTIEVKSTAAGSTFTMHLPRIGNADRSSKSAPTAASRAY